MGHKRKGQVAKETRQGIAKGLNSVRAELSDAQQLQILKDDRPGLSRKGVLKLRERMKILIGPLHG